MAINIQQELQRLYEQNQQQGTSLSERLAQMDSYTSQINPMVTAQTLDFSDRPATYNPLDDLASAVNFSERSRDVRSATSQDLERTQNAGLNLLQQLDSIAQRGAGESPAEKMLRELKLEAAKKDIKDGKLRFNAETGELEAVAGSEVSDTVKEMLTVIDKLRKSNTRGITGVNQIESKIPGTNAKRVEALYNQIQGMLSLENRQKLKGQGQISDYEFKVLSQAASALTRDLSDEDFQATLKELQDKLSGGEGQGQTKQVDKKKDPLGLGL